MSKKKQRVGHKPDRSARPPTPSLIKGLEQADALIQRKRWDEALEVLQSLDRRYPNRPEVLTELVNLYHDLQDMRGYQEACERLVKADPNNPDLALALAGSYAANARPALAMRAFRRFLERWPDHQRAGEVRKTLTNLEGIMREMLADLGLSGEQGEDIAVLHETVQSLLEQGKYRDMRAVAEDLLRRYPNFAPALNNISLAYSLEGKFDQAIATAERVLSFAPDNIHALSNMIRFFCVSGRPDEAAPYARRLKDSTAQAADGWMKKLDGLSYLADDAGILEVYEQALRSGDLEAPFTGATPHHFAAVAALRLGRETEARRYWQQSLKLDPKFVLAQENLADLKKPIDERHVPWAFGMPNWLNQKTIEDLITQTEPAARRGGEAVEHATRRYLRQHPEMVGLVPLLLDRGDPNARQFAQKLAMMAETPEMLTALHDFALGQRGPDELRIEAAHAAAAAGLLPAGLTRLWIKGEWRDLLLLGFEVHGEAESNLTPQVESLLAEAIDRLYDDEPIDAEGLLKRALEIEPGHPSLLNNLAKAYEAQGREADAHALLRQLHERHPDYLFGRIGMAMLHIQKGEIAEAEVMLEPLSAQRRWHISEYAAFCGAQIELLLAQGSREAARSWLDMWENADPDNPILDHFRQRLNQPRWLRRLIDR